MAVSESNVITNVAALTAYSIQTKAQSEVTPTPTGADSNILYNSASRTQGSFSVFYAIATDALTNDIARLGLSPTDAQKEKALALYVAGLQSQKDPDAFAKSVSFEGYSVSRGDGPTGYMAAYSALLSGLTTADSSPFADQNEDGIVKTKDAEDYPDSWRLSGVDTTDSDPF